MHYRQCPALSPTKYPRAEYFICHVNDSCRIRRCSLFPTISGKSTTASQEQYTMKTLHHTMVVRWQAHQRHVSRGRAAVGTHPCQRDAQFSSEHVLLLKGLISPGLKVVNIFFSASVFPGGHFLHLSMLANMRRLMNAFWRVPQFLLTPSQIRGSFASFWYHHIAMSLAALERPREGRKAKRGGKEGSALMVL